MAWTGGRAPPHCPVGECAHSPRGGKIGRRLAQDLVRLPKLPALPLQFSDPRLLRARRPRPHTLIALSLPDPPAQRLRREAELWPRSALLPPLASHSRPHDPAPAERPARVPPPNTVHASLGSPSLHPLKSWSLRKTRRGSTPATSQNDSSPLKASRLTSTSANSGPNNHCASD